MKKTAKWAVIAGLLAGGGYWYIRLAEKHKEAGTPAFDHAKVEVRDIRVTVESTGEVQPRNRLDVKPPIAGRLEQLLVSEGDEVEKGRILGWISSTERATLLDAALATSQGELEYWENLYKPSPLISPLRGVIIARRFEPGQSIGVNDAVLVIADDLIIVANLDETDIGQIRLEQRVSVRLEAYPEREFACKVEKIAYDARTVSNVTMYEVDVRPDRLPPFARSGMTASLQFLIEEKKKALALSASAIQQKAVKPSAGELPAGANRGEGIDSERKKAIRERMRERGLSEAEIAERLARIAAGGGALGRRPGSGRHSNGKPIGISFVYLASGNPEKPIENAIKIGISDGSYTEVLKGLEEGDEVLIPKVNMGSGKDGGSLFLPSGRGRRR